MIKSRRDIIMKRNIYRVICKLGRTKGIRWLISDKCYLRYCWYIKYNMILDLNRTKTFDEKLQWLKIYDKKPEYTLMVDKYEVRNYIKKTIGEEYLIPVLGVWKKFEEINFDELPNRFVLKCTHDSGGIVICNDKQDLDVIATRNKLEKCLNVNYYWSGREWPYKNVKPKIIAEQYMEDSLTKELSDYKFHCFNGQPTYCQMFTSRNSTNRMTNDFYDMNWNHQKFIRTTASKYDKSFHKITEKPKTFEKMKEFAAILSANIPYVRIDFYEVDGMLYFGEITFYPASGFSSFQPKEWEMTWGNMIDLKLVSNT